MGRLQGLLLRDLRGSFKGSCKDPLQGVSSLEDLRSPLVDCLGFRVLGGIPSSVEIGVRDVQGFGGQEVLRVERAQGV